MAGIGETLVAHGRRVQLAAVIGGAKQAAREIATLDYYEALAAIASVVAVVVPQDHYFTAAALALDRVGQIEQRADLAEDAKATYAERVRC